MEARAKRYVCTYIHPNGIIYGISKDDLEDLHSLSALSILDYDREKATLFINLYDHITHSDYRNMGSYRVPLNWNILDNMYPKLKDKYPVDSMLSVEYHFTDEEYKKVTTLGDVEYALWFEKKVMSMDQRHINSMLLTLSKLRKGYSDSYGISIIPASEDSFLISETPTDFQKRDNTLSKGPTQAPISNCFDIPNTHSLTTFKVSKEWKVSFLKYVLIGQYSQLRNSTFTRSHFGTTFNLFREARVYEAYTLYMKSSFPTVHVKTLLQMRPWIIEICCVKGDDPKYSYQAHKVLIKESDEVLERKYFHFMERDKLKEVWEGLSGGTKFDDSNDCMACKLCFGNYSLKRDPSKIICEACKTAYLSVHKRVKESNFIPLKP